MYKFLGDLSSVYWWLSVVAAGLAINLASAYFKTPIDSFLSGISISWNRRSEKQKKNRADSVQAMVADDEHFAYEMNRNVFNMVRTVMKFLLCTCLYVYAVLIKIDLGAGPKTPYLQALLVTLSEVLLFTGTVAMSLATVEMNRVYNHRSEIAIARMLRCKRTPEQQTREMSS